MTRRKSVDLLKHFNPDTHQRTRGDKIQRGNSASLCTTVFDTYLPDDPVHVVFIGHACQLQVDGNVFANVGYDGHSLQGGVKDKLSEI